MRLRGFVKVPLINTLHRLSPGRKIGLSGHGQLRSRRDAPHLQGLAGACGGQRARAAIAVMTVLTLVLLHEVVDGADPVTAAPVPAVAVGTASGPASPSQPAVGVHFLPALALPAVVDAGHPALYFAVQVADVPEHLLVAASRLGVAGKRAVVGEVACPLLLHQLVLTLLCFRELGCYYNQAQVDHEEGAHLKDAEATLLKHRPLF